METAQELDWLRPLSQRIDGLVRDFGFEYFRRHLIDWSTDYRKAIERRDKWRKKRERYAAEHDAGEYSKGMETVEVYEYGDDGVATSSRDVHCRLPAELRHRAEPKVPLQFPLKKNADPTMAEKFVILGSIRDALEDGEKIDIFPPPGVSRREYRRRLTYAVACHRLKEYVNPGQLLRLTEICDDVEQELKTLQLPWLRNWAYRLSDSWQTTSEEGMTDDSWNALGQAVAIGWVELRLQVRYWCLPYEGARNARCTVRGLHGGALGIETEIRKCVPEWSSKPLSIKIGRDFDARLTDKGVSALASFKLDDVGALVSPVIRSQVEPAYIELELFDERKPLLEVSSRWHKLSGLDADDFHQDAGGSGLIQQFNENARLLRMSIIAADRFLNRGMDSPTEVVTFVAAHRSEPVTVGRISAICYVEAAWNLFIKFHTAIYVAQGTHSRSVYEPLDLSAEQIGKCAELIQESVGDDQPLESVLSQINNGASLELAKAKAQKYIPDDLAELDLAVEIIRKTMMTFVASLRGVQANLAGLIPSKIDIPKPPGWSRARAPTTIDDLTKWFKERVAHFREYPKTNPKYMRTTSESAGLVIRAADPRMVQAQLLIGKDVIEQSHLWLEFYGYFEQPPRPTKYEDVTEVDVELSRLLTFLMRKCSGSPIKIDEPNGECAPQKTGKPIAPDENAIDTSGFSTLRPRSSRKQTRSSSKKPLRLSETERDTLIAALELRTFTQDSSVPTARLAEAALGDADKSRLKRPVAKLVKQKLFYSLNGRDGGVWLSVEGRKRAEELKTEREVKR